MEQEPPKTLWERVCPHNVGAALGIDMAPYLLNRRKDLLENLPPGAVTFKATDLAMPIKSGALLPTDVPGEYQLHGSDVKLTKLPCVRHVGTIEEMEKAIDFAEKNNWVSFVLRLRKPSTETFNGKPMTASGDPACDVLHDVFVGKCRTHRPGGPGAKLPVQFLEVYDTDPIANAKEQFPSLSYALPWNFRKGKMTPVRVDPAVVSPESEGFKGCMRDTVARMKKLRPDEWDETSGPERVKMICGRSMYLDFVDVRHSPFPSSVRACLRPRSPYALMPSLRYPPLAPTAAPDERSRRPFCPPPPRRRYPPGRAPA